MSVDAKASNPPYDVLMSERDLYRAALRDIVTLVAPRAIPGGTHHVACGHLNRAVEIARGALRTTT